MATTPARLAGLPYLPAGIFPFGTPLTVDGSSHPPECSGIIGRPFKELQVESVGLEGMDLDQRAVQGDHFPTEAIGQFFHAEQDHAGSVEGQGCCKLWYIQCSKM